MTETNNKPKVILLNGSAHAEGTTHRALKEVADTLINEGIDAEIIHVGHLTVRGCSECYACGKLKKCVHDDIVNEIAEKFKDADGLIIGSPVFYASPNGAFLALLDRLFYSSRFDKSMKVGASVVAARRGGCTASFDVLNKYFTISDMPIVSARYWNQVHGNTPEEVLQDEEGLQTVRVLAQNMIWLMRSIEAGKAAGVEYPEYEPKIRTNFIR